ncbi:MAG: NAD(P)/FAD-dependent oxidoreductase [Myxococcales bacterium]|nr:NAD(P)/FAD-dependent oxidoreductase [Myxococcales bacterium]
MSNPTHHQILIIGGGTGGITVAAQLTRSGRKLDVAILDAAEKHYYQPYWTLVGAGVAPKEVTERNEADLIPPGVTWHKVMVAEIHPDQNKVITGDKKHFTYDYLVVAPGIRVDLDGVEGLRQAIGKSGVCTNYLYEYVDSTWEAIQNTKDGNAIFTFPATPIKCGGAPQKIMWLAEDYFRKQGRRNNINVMFTTAGERIFGVPKYRAALEKLVEARHIDTRWKHNLVAVRPKSKEAVFRIVGTDLEKVIPYSMLHVTPPMYAPDFVRNSPLADPAGYVDVDKGNLRHVRYPNVFSLGDASSLPTAKTGAAVRKQAPVLVASLFSTMDGKPLAGGYTGYTSCPLVTGYGRVILAEFDYDSNPMESFPFDQGKERRSMWILKKSILPTLYWKGMLKGRA